MAEATTNVKKDLQSARDKLNANVPFEQLSPAEQNAIEAEYNFVTSLIIGNKDLMNLFTNAVKQGWDENRFRLEAEKTPWFKENTSSQEWFMIQNDGVAGSINESGRKAVDLKQILGTIRQEVQDYVVSTLGLNVDDAETSKKIDEIANEILTTGYLVSGGWQSTVGTKVGAKFSKITTKDILGGTIGKTISEVTQSYRNLGMMLNEDTATTYAQEILLGKSDINKINQTVRKNAAGMWTQFSDRIMAGENVKDILYPYTQMIGSMLEVDPDSLDFTAEDGSKGVMGQIDPLLQRALFSGADSKQVMSLTDLRKAIKKDSRWQYTRNAQDEYAKLTSELMRMFGAGV